MFAQFESMIKGKINSINEPTFTKDISKIPQKYNIKGKTIQQLKLLSEGSFGFIWLAEQVLTKQKFALKRIVCITNDRLLLAKNELQIMSRLPKSKNLVGCFGGDIVTLRNGNIQNKVMIILMEYCPNGTLFDLLTKRENKGFSQKELLQITYSILEGLKAMHQIDTFHQDVKIENVLIGEDNSFKLCDFGSSSSRRVNFKLINKSEYAHIKQEMQAVTTPMYRPPEIVDPYLQFEVCSKVDIWMVGCVLYTLAYFTHPFLNSNAIGIASGTYNFPKYPEETQYQVSEKMKDLIRNLLTPDPSYRPDAHQVQQIINNWFTLSEIPLNKESKRRKQQQMRKEKQLEILNRKVVDIDGDIPIEKLLELQNKLKNKETTSQNKNSSFITSKDTKLIKEGKGSVNSSISPPIHHPSFQTVNQRKQKQQSFGMDAFWNPTSKPSTSSQNSFDAFNDFLKPPVQAQKPNDISNMYQFFSEPAKSEAEKIPQTKQKQFNLLDL